MTPTLDRGVLLTLFALNAAMLGVEVIGGLMADSMGLIADGLDIGADAAVYLLALLAASAPA